MHLCTSALFKDSIKCWKRGCLLLTKIKAKAGVLRNIVCRAVASLTVPGGQEFHFPHFFLKFRSIFVTFPRTFLIFFLILALRVGDSLTREGPGYATDRMATKFSRRKNPLMYCRCQRSHGCHFGSTRGRS